MITTTEKNRMSVTEMQHKKNSTPTDTTCSEWSSEEVLRYWVSQKQKQKGERKANITKTKKRAEKKQRYEYLANVLQGF